ncbi:MAG: hypothetical protein CO088_02070 [Candidatus Yonathbacteria bacterium CG_4_9_14_0_8_um_filter_46_47]|uniref:GtrA/DPMS transmembrane domain-containing protein n=2 Tax=Parcubacteria group TaxID=1794811 RepID=A0A2M8D7P4_9BACT|nr:MAG: hypothetical protein COW61_00910 [Candidatus Yonathbacteria bacterium CG17_big_fil_post_rev_8_21_14_2_50_46_19]PJB83169.1 MAG: hypothetical protein CO088_02070 [Candidatus Yonathbacteria bacterium CG_4_9_14_0_8_um_filter_46_47]
MKYSMQFFRYLVSGSIATAVNLAALYALTERAGLWYVFSLVIAFAIAFAASFSLQKLWTFSNTEMQRTLPQVFLFLLVQLINLGINAVAVYALVEYAGIWYMAAQFFVLAAISVGSFFVFKFVIFGETVDTEEMTL